MYGMAILIFVFLLLAFLLWMLLQTCPPLLLLFKRWDRYRFEIRAELIGKIENMRDIDVFVLSMRGRIISRCNHCDTDVQIQMFDVTDGVKRPLRIFCADPHMQKDASAEFFSQAHNNVIPARNVILTRWRSIIELKSETLRFPCRGQRRLLFITRICETASGRKLVEAKTRVDYFVAIEEGYLDFRQRQERILTAGWIVAKQTAAQSIKPPQQQLLEQWLNRNAVHKSLSGTIVPGQFAADDAMKFIPAIDSIANISAFAEAGKFAPEIPAAWSLTNIAADCAHIPQLGRSDLFCGFCKNWIFFFNHEMFSNFCECYERADRQSLPRRIIDFIQIRNCF